MIHRGIVQVPAKQEDRVTHVSCDLCGKKQEVLSYYGGDVDWDEEIISYDFARTSTMELCEGSNYSEGQSGDRIRYHVCPKCFKDKLVPWMESQGVKTVKEYL